jgi:hypothetical protein
MCKDYILASTSQVKKGRIWILYFDRRGTGKGRGRGGSQEPSQIIVHGGTTASLTTREELIRWPSLSVVGLCGGAVVDDVDDCPARLC